jgi:Xaa-Pro aminopeptidase
LAPRAYGVVQVGSTCPGDIGYPLRPPLRQTARPEVNVLPRPDFEAHRRALLARLAPDEAVLLIGAPTRLRNGDAEHRYRPDADVWWLTGWPDPEVAIFLRPGATPLTMFVQPRDPELEVWTGRRPGPDGARERFGADQAFAFSELEAELGRLLQGVSTLHYAFAVQPEVDALLMRAVRKAAKAARRNGLSVPETFHAPSHLVHELRLHKLPDEIEIMRAAGRITAEAHLKAMQLGAPGTPEHKLDALLERQFRHEGGTGPGYTSIVAAGDNACILHYVTNDDVIGDGELVLVDAGGEVAYYTADLTRTWPANGRFSPAQRAVYEAVLRAQLAAIALCRPGTTFDEVHLAAVRELTAAMIALGLLQGELDTLIEQETYKKYYMHGTGHWLGLDVHDVGLYGRNGQSRILAPGMVLTVEPGLYIQPDDTAAPEHLRGIGVRIEDDVLITADGHEILTAGAPKDPDELERVCTRVEAGAELTAST